MNNNVGCIFSDEKVKDCVVSAWKKHCSNDVSLSSDEILQWISSPPSYSSVRVNTLHHSTQDVRQQLTKHIHNEYGVEVSVVGHDALDEVLVVLPLHSSTADAAADGVKRVIVDCCCGEAVLRGAHVYAPGVKAVTPGVSIGDLVGVYADITGGCLRGWMKPYTGPCRYVGAGRIHMTREQIFSTNSPSGLCVSMSSAVQPSLCGVLRESIFVQNLPSILASYSLHITPQHTVLDMCAAPGGKSTHIAALLQGQGRLVSIDKVKSKMRRLQDMCRVWGIENMSVHCYDSTRCYDVTATADAGPPYPAHTFDRVLLDAPCSGMGQRPRLYCSMSHKELTSYPPLQKALFKNAVSLVKPGGRLVYCTCTVMYDENEGIVEWALSHYPCLTLVPAHRISGTLPGVGVSEEVAAMLIRCGLPSPHTTHNTDTIGFFIAAFQKEKS